MKLNADKTKYMIFNFCRTAQFQTRLHLDNSILEQVRQTKLLGVLLSDDLTWQANTSYIVKKAYMRMTILRKLFEFKIKSEDLIHIYILYIRSVVEQSCVVWASSITIVESTSIERVQKIAFRIIYGERYHSYENALLQSKLPTLAERRTKLCLNFALKCVQNSKTSQMFPLNPPSSTRQSERYRVPHAYTERYMKSAIPNMARQLNQYSKSNKK